MDIADLIAPWLSLLMILVPLIYAERWIHQHLFGVSYLMTDDKETATGIYYIFFFPGVFLHEVIQYLVAGALNVPIKKIQAYPKAQENGTLRFDFVSIKPTDPVRASIIGGVPFIIAAFLVYTISTSIIDLHSIVAAFSANNSKAVTTSFQDLVNTPNFWFWLYLLFVISNGMIPTKEDRQGWWLILAVIGGLTLILIIIGSDQVITETLAGPVRENLQLVNTSLVIILGLDIFAIIVLRTVENIFERIRGYRVNYHTGEKKKSTQKSAKRQVGSNVPIPKGELMPSIYNLELPIPPLPPKRTAARAMKQAATDVASGRPPSATDSPTLRTSPRVPPSGPARTTAEVPAISSSVEPDRTTAAASPPQSPLRRSPSETQPTAEGATERPRPSFSRPATDSPASAERPSVGATSSIRRPSPESSDPASPSQSPLQRSPSGTKPTDEGTSERARPSFSRPTTDSPASPKRPSVGATSSFRRPSADPASPSQSPLHRPLSDTQSTADGATERSSSSETPRRTFGRPSDSDDKDAAQTSSTDAPARPIGRTSPLSSFSRDRSVLGRRTSDSDQSASPDRPRSPFSRPSQQGSSRFPTSRQPSPPDDEDQEADDDIEYVDFDDA